MTLESPGSAITFLDKKDVKKPFVSQKTTIEKVNSALEKSDNLQESGSVCAV